MKVNELRIGNIVGFKDRTDFYARINDISVLGGVHISRFWEDGTLDDQPEVIEDLTPIPLTEKWLLKFGFEKTEGMHVNTYKKMIKSISTVEEIYMIISSKNYYWVGYRYNMDLRDVGLGELNYVHQLQNLVFALTGEEL
jgi:hypothetical protein